MINLNVGWVWCILRNFYFVGVSVCDKFCVICVLDSVVDSVVFCVCEIDVNVFGVCCYNVKFF